MNFVMTDHSRGVLDQLQGATKFHGLIELAFHYGPNLGIEKRNNALRDTFAGKFLLGLLNQLFAELDALAKLLFKLARRCCRQLFESLRALGQHYQKYARAQLSWSMCSQTGSLMIINQHYFFQRQALRSPPTLTR